jgi:hypothetical protein
MIRITYDDLTSVDLPEDTRASDPGMVLHALRRSREEALLALGAGRLADFCGRVALVECVPGYFRPARVAGER